MPRLQRYTPHGIEHDDGYFGACLLQRQRHTRHCGPDGRAHVSRSKMIHGVAQDIILAFRTGTKPRLGLANLRVHFADDFLDRVNHPAMGNETRSATGAPVKVEPVVPVSSTVR